MMGDPARSRGFNQSASSSQANPNKSKQKGLDLLGFIRPNRYFSMGYGESTPVSVVFKMSQAALSLLSDVPARHWRHDGD
jgi:hypothetical protein